MKKIILILLMILPVISFSQVRVWQLSSKTKANVNTVRGTIIQSDGSGTFEFASLDTITGVDTMYISNDTIILITPENTYRIKVPATAPGAESDPIFSADSAFVLHWKDTIPHNGIATKTDLEIATGQTMDLQDITDNDSTTTHKITWRGGNSTNANTAYGWGNHATMGYLTSVGTGVENQLTYWSGTNTLGSLSTATYPTLTQLSYVKGVTSGIQAQLNTKLSVEVDGSITNEIQYFDTARIASNILQLSLFGDGKPTTNIGLDSYNQDLTYATYSDKGIMNISGGTGDTIPAVTSVNAGLMLPGDKNKLDSDILTIVSGDGISYNIIYGALYNNYVTEDSRKISSTDTWTVPTESQIEALFDYIGDYNGGDGMWYNTGELKETGTTHWYSQSSNTTNTANFSMRGSGRRIEGAFSLLTYRGFLWSDSQSSYGTPNQSWMYKFEYSNEIIEKLDMLNNSGASIRLRRSATTEEQLLPDGTFLENYVGNNLISYPTVKVGTQVFTAVNLAETKWRTGAWIAGYDGGVYTPYSDNDWNNLTTSALCFYSDEVANYGEVASLTRGFGIGDTIYFDATLTGIGTADNPIGINLDSVLTAETDPIYSADSTAINDTLSAHNTRLLAVEGLGTTGIYDPKNVYVCLMGSSATAAYLGYNGVDYYLITDDDKKNGDNIKNLAVPGHTINNQLAAWNADPDTLLYDAIVVQIGGNDISNYTETTADVITRYQAFIDRINVSKRDDAIIIAGKINPFKERLDSTATAYWAAIYYQRWLDVNNAIMGYGSTPITGIDVRVALNSDLLNDGNGNLIEGYDYGDYIHYNNTAREIVANTYRKALKQYGFLRFEDKSFGSTMNASTNLNYNQIISKQGLQLGLDNFKYGSIGGAGNPLISAGASSMPVWSNLGTGYLPYKSATSFVNSPIITDGTRVAIGTTINNLVTANIKNTGLYGVIVNSNNTLGNASGGIYGAYSDSIPTASDQRIGILHFGSRNIETQFYNTAAISALSAGSWSAGSSHPTYLDFQVTPSGSATRKSAMRINSNNTVSINNTNSTYGLDVTGTINTANFYRIGGTELKLDKFKSGSLGTTGQIPIANSSTTDFVWTTPTTNNIASSTDKRYLTDAQLTVVQNTSGTNSGDQTLTYTPSTRLLDISGSATDATLPLFSTTNTDAGLVPGGTSISTKYLRGDGTWQTVSAGGGINSYKVLSGNVVGRNIDVTLADYTPANGDIISVIPDSDIATGDTITFSVNGGTAKNIIDYTSHDSQYSLELVYLTDYWGLLGKKAEEYTVKGSNTGDQIISLDSTATKYQVGLSGSDTISISKPVTDHGNLTGLADDDHTQYAKADGTRAFTGIVSYDAAKTFTTDNQIVTKKYVDDAIIGGGGYTDEQAQDAVGAMVTGNTETYITVEYDDTNAKLNFAVNLNPAIEVVDIAYNATNFDGKTAQGVSGDDFYDYNHTHDTDDDGLPNKVDLSSAGLVKTDANGVLSVATAGSDYDGSVTNEIQTLTYTASTRLLDISGTATDATLPLFTSTEAGLVPLSGGGTTNFLRADGTWAAAGGSYTLPLAADGTRGGIQIGYTSTANNFALQLSTEKAFTALPDATTSVKGIASFSSTNFDVTSGAVSIANAGVTAANLANGTISGLTEVSSGLTNTDEIMLSYGGMIRKTDLSVLKDYMAIPAASGTSGLVQLSNGSGAFTSDADFSLNGSTNALTVGSGSGNGSVTSGNFILSSDRRLKERIERIPDLNWVDKIDFKTFRFKNDETKRQRYGVIAQEVESINPELVFADEYGNKAVGYIDLLIAKVARQDEVIEQLLKRIEKLENEK